MKKVSHFLIILSLCLYSFSVMAQASKTFPSDLKVLAMKDLINLDPALLSDVPIYDINGKLISQEKAKELTFSGEFFPDFYADASGKPVAQKLRRPTAREKAMMNSLREEQERMDALIGTPAAQFETVDIEGNPINLEDMKGSVVAINFWFIGCKPCIQEMPELNEIVAEFKDQDVKFVALALDSQPALEKFLTKKQFDYDIIAKGRDIAKQYDVSGYPTHCIVDQEGNIAYFQTGYSNLTAQEVKQTIEKLLHK